MRLQSSGKIMGIGVGTCKSLLFGEPRDENRGQTPIPQTESVSVPAFLPDFLLPRDGLLAVARLEFPDAPGGQEDQE